MLHKSRAFNVYSRDRNNTDLFNKFQSLQAHLKTIIEEPKLKYYSRLSDKLLDSKTSPKSYWSILKAFLNNKKIPYIPPLLHNGKFITTLRKRLNSLMTFLQSSVLLLITIVNFPRFLLKKRASHFHRLSFQHLIF